MTFLKQRNFFPREIDNKEIIGHDCIAKVSTWIGVLIEIGYCVNEVSTKIVQLFDAFFQDFKIKS